MATSRLLDPFYVLGTRLDLTGRRARRLMMAAFEALDPDQVSEAAVGAGVVDVLVDHFLDAQIEALDAASEYLSAVAPGPIQVLAPADGFLGQMGTQTVRAFVERTPQGIVARITSGMAPEDALAEAADYIAKVGDAEPHIIGRDSVATVANNDDRFAGYARVARPDACAWCKMLAGRGAVYTKDTAILTRDGQPYHQKRPNGSGGTCRCRMVAVPVDHLGLPPTQYTPPRAGQYAMTTSRYREGSGTPERAGSIDRQLQILRQQLATGKGTDWTRARIARLESERMSSALGRSSTLFLRYDPNQPRDETGKWSASGGGGATLAAKQAAAKAAEEAAWAQVKLNNSDAAALKATVAADLGQRMSNVPAKAMADCVRDLDETDSLGFNIAMEEIEAAAGTVDAPYVHLARDLDGNFYAAYKGESPIEGWQYARPGTPEYDAMVREGSVAGLVDMWAQSSNDHHEGSLAVQMAVRHEFGLEGAAGWSAASGEAAYRAHAPVLNAYARAMYENTQADLAARGITEVTVYRGTGIPLGDEKKYLSGSGRTVTLRPASSWSEEQDVAQSFAQSAADNAGTAAQLTATVPASRVLSTPNSGVGCLSELEVVLLGGTLEVEIYRL